MQIKLAENFRAVFYAPFYATYELGLYKKEGVDVVLTNSATPADMMRSLLGGAIDIAWGGPLRSIKDQDATRQPPTGASPVSFCEMAGKDPFFLIGKPSKGAFTLADLGHLRLGRVSEVPTPWLCLQQDLRDIGIDPDGIQGTSDRSMAQNLAALEAGELDVVQAFEPFVSQAIEKGIGQVIHAASDRGPTAYTTFVATRDSFARHHAEFLAMARAIEHVGVWMAQNGPEQLASVVKSYFPEVAHETLVKAMARYMQAGVWTCNAQVSRQGFERLREGMYTGGFIGSRPSYEDCVAEL